MLKHDRQTSIQYYSEEFTGYCIFKVSRSLVVHARRGKYIRVKNRIM